MKREIWKEEYIRINDSFKEKLVFRLGAEAGFYSEFNNLILAIIYSLSNKIKLNLHCEGDINFFRRGWTDYFEPFFTEVKYIGLKRYNVRPYMAKSKDYRYLPAVLKKIYRITYLTQDLFQKINSIEINNIEINEPSLHLKGHLLDISKVVINNVYKFRDEISYSLKEEIQKLNLPEEYIAVHIRQGDKIIESDVVDAQVYYEYIKQHFKCNNIFVYTDNFLIIDKLSKLSPSLNIYSLTEPHEKGYYHKDFLRLDSLERKDLILKMFLNMEILYKGKYFLGTFDSNIGMFMNMRKGGENCFDVLNRDWMIW